MALSITKLQWQKRLRGADLTAVEYMVVSTMATYASKEGTNIHPGWARLVNDTHLDVRTIKKAARSLVEKGWLVLSQRGGNHIAQGFANVYELTIPVVHKGGTPCTPCDEPDAPARGTSGAARGTSGAREGGHPVYPHQGSTSGASIHHSADQVQRAQLASERAADDDVDWTHHDSMPPSWLDLIDDYEELEAWLESDLIGLDDVERSTALGMWEAEEHPKAIRNTIAARRAAA